MIKHNVITILKNLSMQEITFFKRFVNSPYHNKSKKIIHLFNKLIKFYPYFNSKHFTRQYLMSQISPQVNFNASTYRVLMHDLNLLLQTFLINESLRQNKAEHNMMLLKDLYKRKLYTVMNKQLKRTDRIIYNRISDNNFYFYKFLIESYKYNINLLTSSTLKKGNASKRFRLFTGSDLYLTLFFITEIISDFTNQVIYKSKFNIDDQDNFSKSLIAVIDFNKIFKLFDNYNDIKHIVKLYKFLYDLFCDIGNKIKFEKYRDFLRKSEKLLSRDETSFHYSKLISCCILNYEIEDKLYYNNELFYLYDYFIKMRLYRDNKSTFLPANLYRTVILNAVRLKKFKWVIEFIEYYTNDTEEKARINLFNWSYAVFYSETGDNVRSLEFINRIKADYFIFKYDLYNIKLKIYYEYEDPETVINFIRTYREFLRNDKFFSGNRKIIYKNFIKAVELMVKCREKKNTFDIEYLKNKFLKTEKTLFKEWILQKVKLIEISLKDQKR